MGEYFINHRHCPDCGHRLKSYYWYCGNCGNQDLTNWAKTLVMWAIMALIVGVGLLFVRSHLCSNPITAQAFSNITPPKLQCK